jgi:copper chaperone CopZ
MEQVTFRIPAIHCAGCVGSIRLAMRRAKGVLKVEGDDKNRMVTIAYDPQLVSPERLHKTLDGIGFPPQP